MVPMGRKTERHLTVEMARSKLGGRVLATLTVVHAYECPNWKSGRSAGSCNCGAVEAWDATIGDLSNPWKVVATKAEIAMEEPR